MRNVKLKCKAEIVLSEQLVNNSEFKRPVCKYWGEYVHIVETVAKSNLTKKLKIRFIDDTHRKTIAKIEKSKFPEKLKTYFKNVISTKCKNLNREIEAKKKDCKSVIVQDND